MVPGIAQRRDDVRPSAPTGHLCLEHRVIRPRAAGVGIAGDASLLATLAVMRRRKTSRDLVGHQHHGGKCVGKVPLAWWRSAVKPQVRTRGQEAGVHAGNRNAHGKPAHTDVSTNISIKCHIGKKISASYANTILGKGVLLNPVTEIDSSNYIKYCVNPAWCLICIPVDGEGGNGGTERGQKRGYTLGKLSEVWNMA